MAIASSSATSLLLGLLLLGLAGRLHAGSIAIYWGQNRIQSSLADACATGNFEFVNLGFIPAFRTGQLLAPALDFTGFCSPFPGGCARLSADIRSCQQRGVKVLLSLGGAADSYRLASSEDARRLAAHLWENFLGGSATTSVSVSASAAAVVAARPFGDVFLDGVDFRIEESSSSSQQYWVDLARHLRSYTRSDGRRILLSAAPLFAYPDAWLGGAALEPELFDFVWLQFLSNQVGQQYSFGSGERLAEVWRRWASLSSVRRVFLGLAAAPEAGGAFGYIPPRELISQVLPVVKRSEKYGGIMLVSDYYEAINRYTSAIRTFV